MTVTSQQKHGVIVCLPKPRGAQTPADYRPITLLNTDYKLLSRTITHLLRPVLEEQLQTSQFCGVPGNTIFEAVATVREPIAQAETKNTSLCVLSSDFQDAFEKISHQYLFTVRKSYGLSDWFIDRTKGMYENATSSVQINGHIARPIPIRCAIRQGCPMSMMLYALCLHPLLRMLEKKLPGIQQSWHTLMM